MGCLVVSVSDNRNGIDQTLRLLSACLMFFAEMSSSEESSETKCRCPEQVAATLPMG